MIVTEYDYQELLDLLNQLAEDFVNDEETLK
jgi:hypothetical protein